MKNGNYRVISLFSRPDKKFDDYPYRQFYLLDEGNIVLHSVEEFASFVEADLNELCFRNRLIPEIKKVRTIPIGEYSNSKDIQLYQGQTDIHEVVIQDTRPKNQIYDGIVVDLMLARTTQEREYSEKYQPHGLGVVAWAILHSIPVGIVYEDSGNTEFRRSNFWIESVLDTLATHPACQGCTIPSGDVNTVYSEMRELLLNL